MDSTVLEGLKQLFIRGYFQSIQMGAASSEAERVLRYAAYEAGSRQGEHDFFTTGTSQAESRAEQFTQQLEQLTFRG